MHNRLIFLLLSSLISSTYSWAGERSITCQSKLDSAENRWYLESNCPIGEGIWGNNRTLIEAKSFWIQCGFVKNDVFDRLAKRLEKSGQEAVWLKREAKNQRCLLGPYHDYKMAKSNLIQVRKLKGLDEAFIRSVDVVLRVQSGEKTTHSSSKRAVASNNQTRQSTPYMIAGKHGVNDCECYF